MDLSFSENMSGYIFPGESDEKNGFTRGKENNFEASINGAIYIHDVKKFITISEKSADLTGSVSIPGLGEKLTIKSGNFNCYRMSFDKKSRRLIKIMEYKIFFVSEINEPYFLHGQKELIHDKGEFDLLKDSTTLFVKIYKGQKEDSKKIYASGILHVGTKDTMEMLISTRVHGAKKLSDKVSAITSFYNFFIGESYGIYFKKLGFFYSTDYQNFVLTGNCIDEGIEKKFMFYSGAHNQGFPWGDEQSFWDLSFIMEYKDGSGNITYDKYLFADYELYDRLKLNVIDGGISRYSYKGKIYKLKSGYSVSFLDDIVKNNKDLLEELDADIAFDFKAFAPKEKGKPVTSVIVPFGLTEGLDNPFLIYINNLLKKYLPYQKGLGVRLGIRSVELKKASIKINDKNIRAVLNKCWGEAESSTIKYVKEPTLNYNYFCGINPSEKKVLIHTYGGVLFNDQTKPVKNIIDYGISLLAKPFASIEATIVNSELKTIDRKPKALKIKDDYILEVNFDHYKTAVFQRRIVLLKDSLGAEILALEEDVKRINLSAAASAGQIKTESPLDKKESIVAVYKSSQNWSKEWQDPAEDKPGIFDNMLGWFNLTSYHNKNGVPVLERIERENEDKKQLLHQVVQSSLFIESLHKRAEMLKKSPAGMKIVIKPNLMFLYDKNDRSTYTDPVLIKELADIIYNEGFTDITIVEAQSTYGNYFQNRDVVNVARYVGLEACKKYKVMDLSDQKHWVKPIKPFTGALKPINIDGAISETLVPKIWQDADFRISFAKNKTHCYTFYTLTLKNIYGSLPVQNKYKEYHCNRGIVDTTMEYIIHYPVHFGFIDAYISSDGPFGVFANKVPNYTRTLIGGENLVAVDWIGSAKMGLDPMVSPFMKSAVKNFGKPRIKLIGDCKDELYTPWINVPLAFGFIMTNFVDKSYEFGNAFTNAMMSIDKTAFPPIDDAWWMKLIKFFDAPMRGMVYENHKELKRRYDLNPFDEIKDKNIKDIEF